jgi:putative radical SAM enzyme (TIGR03279 family)
VRFFYLETFFVTTSTRLQPIGAPGDLISGVEFGEGQARQHGRKGKPRGGVVDTVDAGSPCDLAGIQPNDVLLSVNGQKLRDVIDFQFFSADEEVLRIEVAPRGDSARNHVVDVYCESGEVPGVSFTEPTFAPIRECNNHCPFCFIDQLPGSMRNSLYIRDDDYRYSFLFGNFVTLTNLNERDWQRLGEQRLSPLYVSVHATDLKMRRVLLGNDRVPDIIRQFERLFSMGIRVHTQVVTCPGMNDGEILERTVADLAAHFPDVLSIGVVPVGLTRTPQEILSGPDPSCSRILPSAADLPMRTFLPEEARAVVKATRKWQRDLRRRFDSGVVYASDEFYLLCHEPIPSTSSYDGYPQYENGIGMVRDLMDDWKRLRRRLARITPPRSGPSVTLVCGEMIADTLHDLTGAWATEAGARVDLVPVPNRFFGPRVRVSGLLTGGDIMANAHRFTGDVVILPSVMLDKTASRLLDGVTPTELEQRLGKPVYFAGYLSEVDRIVFEDAHADRSQTLGDPTMAIESASVA